MYLGCDVSAVSRTVDAGIESMQKLCHDRHAVEQSRDEKGTFTSLDSAADYCIMLFYFMLHL